MICKSLADAAVVVAAVAEADVVQHPQTLPGADMAEAEDQWTAEAQNLLLKEKKPRKKL